MRRIYVGGVHGVGKTTIFSRAREILPNYRFVEYSGLILNYMSGITSVDELNSLPYEDRVLAKDKVYEWLSSLNEDFILDSHYSILIMCNGLPERFEFGIPEKFVNAFTDFVLIEANPNVLFERRAEEYSKRRVLDRKIIEVELLVERMFAQLVTGLYEKKLHIIDNSGELTKGCDDFVKIIKAVESS